MELTGYRFVIKDDPAVYDFVSEGPKGSIKKKVSFRRMTGFAFNLCFGDVNADDSINDIVISDNNDADKVLITVAQIVIDFTNKRPYAIIYVEGSTRSRTRRYQMGLNRFWQEIERIFTVYGYTSQIDFELFRSGRNYIAFAAKRKINNLVF